MKKLLGIVLVSAMIATTSACSSTTSGGETLTGVAKGFGGELTVEVTMDGDDISSVEVVEHSESEGISDPAIEEVPQAIVDANSTEVDTVSGATLTSEAIINAVNNALDPEGNPAPEEEVEEDVEPDSVSAAEVYQGFGLANMERMGPGADNEDVPVYSINQVFANTLFDQDGKIIAINVDQLEVATPNYDGDGMPHFSGFPGQDGYNFDEDHDAVVDGITENTEESFAAELEGWKTKRERGDAYVMGTGTWTEQMDAFQELFVGKTVEEVEEWFGKYTSDVNGRPLKEGSDNEEDQEKYDGLSDEEKAELADVVSSATMSLNDAHGDIVAAIRNSYENRVPLEDLTSASAMGNVMLSTPRIGPGADNEDVSVYSINQVFANTLFDDDGKIIAINVDQLEVATPNYDGDGMPHFSGFPGQGGYNFDENHDAEVDGTTEDTEENFAAEIEGWKTKRERGDAYVMGTGTWTEQMDAFQELFVGKTAEEVEEWFGKYTSDVNGRPLKEGSEDAEDQEKYDALSDEEKEELADVVSSATMSLNDSHGDLVGAIVKSFENRVEIDLTVE